MILASILLISLWSYTPPSSTVSLLVAESTPGKKNIQELYQYTFVDGNFAGRAKIVSVPTIKEGGGGSYVRFDIGTNRIYRNRYVITGIGNIIDIEGGKVLLEEKDQFVKFSGDSIIFYTDDIFKGKYYSFFDLKTSTYSKIENPAYKPNPGRDIEVDYSSKIYKIWYYPPSAQKVLLVKDAGYGEEFGDKRATVPVIWIDNGSFIYASYSAGKDVATVFKVNMDKTTEEIGSIAAIPHSDFNSYFYKDPEGNIHFACAKGVFEVDMKKKKISQLKTESLGNGFTVETEENPQQGRTIQYNGSEIGKYFFNYRGCKTHKGHIALNYDIVVQKERYPQGVTTWSEATGKWREIGGGDVVAIVGWIEE